jgi:hypothetical protein
VEDDNKDPDYRPSGGEDEVEEVDKEKQTGKRRAATKKHRETASVKMTLKHVRCEPLHIGLGL